MDYEIWRTGLAEEKKYWSWALENNKENLAFRFQPDTEIQEYLKPFITVRSKILDVGAGIATTLGKLYQGNRLNIIAVDILADTYNQLLAEKNIIAPVPTRTGSYENLINLFGERYFDFVHSCNSIDHCHNPLQGIKNMIEVCKSNGFVFVQAHENEAERLNYHGLHQWNFALEYDGMRPLLKLKDKQGNQIIVNDHILQPIIYADRAKNCNGHYVITAIIHNTYIRKDRE